MRRITIRNLMVCLIAAALIWSLGTRNWSSDYDSGRTADSGKDALSGIARPFHSQPISAGLTQSPSIKTEVLPLNQVSPDPALQPPFQATPTARLASQIVDIPKNKESEVHISSSVSAKPIRTYEVTAYYLNVRANGYSKSKIVNVVEKGTRLEIVAENDSGWLRIKGGGYVHGDYAKLVEEKAEIGDGTDQNNPIQGGTEGPEERKAEEVPDKPAEPVQPTSTVGTFSGLSEEDIAVIFEGTALAGHGLEKTVLEVEKDYGINALFTIAVMKLESGNGSSKLAKKKNNLFGLNASGANPHDKAFSFETKGDSVRKFGQLLSDNYVDKGYTTIEKIAKKYCPANSQWPKLVKNIMKRDFKKLNVI